MYVPPEGSLQPTYTGAQIIEDIQAVAAQLGIPANLAEAIAQVESGFNPYAVGDAGTSFGLYQLHEGGELGSLTPAQAFDPTVNAETALSQVASIYQANPNADPGAIAAAAQRPSDPTAYANQIDAILNNLSLPPATEVFSPSSASAYLGEGGSPANAPASTDTTPGLTNAQLTAAHTTVQGLSNVGKVLYAVDNFLNPKLDVSNLPLLGGITNDVVSGMVQILDRGAVVLFGALVVISGFTLMFVSSGALSGVLPGLRLLQQRSQGRAVQQRFERRQVETQQRLSLQELREQRMRSPRITASQQTGPPSNRTYTRITIPYIE